MALGAVAIEDRARELHAQRRARVERVRQLLRRRRGGVKGVIEEVRPVVDLVTEPRRAHVGGVLEAAELSVGAPDEIEAEGPAQGEPVARTPVRARRPDEALDVLIGFLLVDVAGRRGAPAKERVARRIQVVLEAGPTIDVRRDAEDARIVALGEAKVLLDVTTAEREVCARRQRQVQVRPRGLASEMARTALC